MLTLRAFANSLDFPLSAGAVPRSLMPGLADCTETSDSLSASYSLYAVSNHMGSLRGGHYTAYCRHPTKKRWFEFNDQHVQAVQVRR